MNGEYKGSDEIGRMIHDFHCIKADDIYNPELAKSVRHFKDEERGKNMCASVKAYGDEREARGEARGRAEAEVQLAEKDAIIAAMQAELEKYKALAAMKS